MGPICECGCAQPIPVRPWHKYSHPRFINRHHLGLMHAAAKTYHAARREPPAECACGCGQQTGTTGRTRNKFVNGHSKRGKTGSAAGGWKGGRRISTDGYVNIYEPSHHLSAANGYYAEHRLVWEQANGRRLETGEDVHHINGDTQDNRPENLVALSKSDHMKAHMRNPNSFATSAQLRAAGLKGAAARWGK